MDDYEALVAKAFALLSPLPFSNESAAHARVIMKNVLANADKHVYLYTDSLPAESEGVLVYDWPDLSAAAELFLNKDSSTKLSIKVAGDRSETASAKFVQLSQNYKDQCSIDWGVGKKGPNFMVSDAGAFRLEYSQAKAIACANDEDTANKLRSIYQNKI